MFSFSKDMWCLVMECVEENHRYACYMLVSATGEHNRTYIGFTVDPRKRIRQHNGDIKGGAKYTKRGRPWKIDTIVRGFPTQRKALSFEWHWKRARGIQGRRNRARDLMRTKFTDSFAMVVF